MLGISRPTTYRYVSTLVAQGYLRRDPSRKYRLDLGAIDLGMGTLGAMGLCRHARPELETLARRSDHTVELGVLDGPEVLRLACATPTAGPRGSAEVGVENGARIPAYCTSMGKVLLAHLSSDQQLKRIAETDLRKLGPKTITDARELRAQLARVRRAALAVDDEESGPGTCAIAAAVRNEVDDVVAAVSVAAYGGATDVQDLIAWRKALAVTAERVSRRLGWAPRPG
jgi:IclR family pca regulon transcriptional regulator